MQCTCYIYQFGRRDMLVTRLKLNLPDYKQRLCGSFRDMDSWAWYKSEHRWICFTAMDSNDIYIYNCTRIYMDINNYMYIYVLSNTVFQMLFKLSQCFAANWSKTVKRCQKCYDPRPRQLKLLHGSSRLCLLWQLRQLRWPRCKQPRAPLVAKVR